MWPAPITRSTLQRGKEGIVSTRVYTYSVWMDARVSYTVLLANNPKVEPLALPGEAAPHWKHPLSSPQDYLCQYGSPSVGRQLGALTSRKSATTELTMHRVGADKEKHTALER